MACNQVNILNYNHNFVEVTSGDNFLVITDNNKCNSITIPQPVTNILQINTPGPQGAQGPSGSSVFVDLGNGVYAASGSFLITGSLTVSSSNTFTNIGPTVLVGNVSITGSDYTNSTISFISGAVITTSGPNLDMTAGPGGWSEIGSNNGQNYVWVDDNYIRLATNWALGAHIWYIDQNGNITGSGNIDMTGYNITASLLGTSSYALTASYAMNGGGGGGNTFPFNGAAVITGSLLVSGSGLKVIGDQIMSGSIVFDGGVRITPTYYGTNNGGIDIVAGPGGFAELVSNNSQSYIWVDDTGVFVLTANSHQFEFRDDGYFVIPQVQSLTKQAGILSAGDIIIQADETQSWRFSSGSGILTAPGGIIAPSFTGSLQGTASYANTASVAPNYLPLAGGTVTGDLTINQNLTVLGSSSIQYITSSQLNIGTNLITVNTATPAVRFGGLAVYDSGSTGTGKTGSLLWDSQNDVWIYSNPSGAAYDGAMILAGPRNSTGIGNEAGINQWYAAIGNGSHHMTSSAIYNSGSLIRLETNTQITGSLNVSAGITGSLQGTATTASYVLNAISSSFATTASFVQNAQTASYVLQAVSASFATTASFVQNAQTASYTPISRSFGIVIDGGGSAITTGIKTDVIVPFNMTISSWTIIADQVGSIVVDVWKDTYANFPPTVADSIAGSEKPTLSSATKNQDTNLTTWTTAVTAGDIIRFNVDSVSTVTKVTLIINGIS